MHTLWVVSGCRGLFCVIDCCYWGDEKKCNPALSKSNFFFFLDKVKVKQLSTLQRLCTYELINLVVLWTELRRIVGASVSESEGGVKLGADKVLNDRQSAP